MADGYLVIHSDIAEIGAIGFAVMNFPILPIGAEVEIVFDGEYLIENCNIEKYRVNNDRGLEITLKYSQGSKEFADERLRFVVTLCKKDPKKYYDYIYPKVLDYDKFQSP